MAGGTGPNFHITLSPNSMKAWAKLNGSFFASIEDCGIMFCKILLIIAIGKRQKGVIIQIPGDSGDVRYRQDNEGIPHILKRDVDEIIVNQH